MKETHVANWHNKNFLASLISIFLTVRWSWWFVCLRRSKSWMKSVPYFTHRDKNRGRVEHLCKKDARSWWCLSREIIISSLEQHKQRSFIHQQERINYAKSCSTVRTRNEIRRSYVRTYPCKIDRNDLKKSGHIT